jgi:hypothetical protein
MAVTSLGTFCAWPGVLGVVGAAPAVGNDQTIDASGEYVAFVGVAQEAMTVSHIGFRPSTVVSSGAATVGIYTVDPTTGVPTTTEFTVTTTGSKVDTGALTSNTWGLFELTDAAVIPTGAVYAVKILYQGGTSFITTKLSSVFPVNTCNLPYTVTNTSGSAVKARQNGPMNVVLGSNSTTFYPVFGLTPATAITAGAFDNSTAGAKRGMRFQVPVAMRVMGIRWYNSDNDGDYNIIIEDDSNNALSNSATAIEGLATAASTSAIQHAFFDNPVTLSAGTWYKAMIEPSEANNVNLTTLTLPSSAYAKAYMSTGNIMYTTYTTGGGPSNTDTQIPFMDLLIDGIDITTSGARIIGG